MTNFQTKLTTAIATGAVLLNALAMPALASSITISGNGSFSNNDASVNLSNDVNVSQNNDANIDNHINVEATTGDNSADDNTGGDTSVNTGDANVDVTVVNKANKNNAVVNQCCPRDLNVEISGNGTHSDNSVDVDVNNDVNVDQDNYARFNNNIDAESETGENSADDNTGGDVTINTGDADTSVHVLNAANANFATVGGGDGNGGGVSAKILGNGSHSDNNIDLNFDNDVDLDQNNYADFYNDVNAEATTGDNSADDNTGGDVSVDTGDADLTVDVANFANFNWANIDGCGCFDDLEAKIAGNGTDSDSEITFDSDKDLDADQDNYSRFKNDVYADDGAETGANSVDDNTSWNGGDPSVDTGDADASVDVHNFGNHNVFGNSFDFEWDWSDLLSWIGGSHSG